MFYFRKKREETTKILYKKLYLNFLKKNSTNLFNECHSEFHKGSKALCSKGNIGFSSECMPLLLGLLHLCIGNECCNKWQRWSIFTGHIMGEHAVFPVSTYTHTRPHILSGWADKKSMEFIETFIFWYGSKVSLRILSGFKFLLVRLAYVLFPNI